MRKARTPVAATAKVDTLALGYHQALGVYLSVMRDHDVDRLRALALDDLFFLLVFVLGRKDANCEWIFDRCREVQAEPHGRLELWARGHYKSSVGTFALTIQKILNDPEKTHGIFSHTRPIAKQFLAQIKREFEANELLKSLFSDVLYAAPQKESPRWSMDDGLVVKRVGNPKESTLEAWGLVDGQPTSKHFDDMVYDDVVTAESVSTPEQIQKTTQAFELSMNLGADGGTRRMYGTRYHFADTYAVLIKRGVRPRVHAATDDGTRGGRPVLFSSEAWAEKLQMMGGYVLSCQMLQNPIAEGSMGFRPDWLRYYDQQPDRRSMNVAIIADPASKRKKSSDFTSMWVVGLGRDGQYYILDGVHDRMNLTQRAAALFRLHAKWRPFCVGYEEYGLQADIEHVQYEMEQRSYRFSIIPLGGHMPKEDRIRRLVPIYEQGRMWMPRRLLYVDTEGRTHDLVHEYVEQEYGGFPVAVHDDMIDCLARITDEALGVRFPLVDREHPFAVAPERPAVTNDNYDVLSSGGAFAMA